MKRAKKMLALVLALMMAFTCLAMPAMAAGEDEGIMPRYRVRACPICGQEGQVEVEEFTHSYEVKGCGTKVGTHMHTDTTRFYRYTECGHLDYVASTTCG